jgi:hypothetical protein
VIVDKKNMAAIHLNPRAGALKFYKPERLIILWGSRLQLYFEPSGGDISPSRFFENPESFISIIITSFGIRNKLVFSIIGC